MHAITATIQAPAGKLAIGHAVHGKESVMMPPYKNTHAAQPKPGPQPVFRPEQSVPPVLQQTTQLYQPYQPKKEDKQ